MSVPDADAANGPEKTWRFRRVLITGGGGYLAANVVRRLERTSTHVRRLCRRPADHAAGRSASVEDVVADVREPAIWERLIEGVDLVLHFAAQTSAHVAEVDPLEDHDVNVLPMLRLLESCRRRAHEPVVLFSGTVTQVGLTTAVPVDERSRDTPATVYDLHKWMAENYLGYYVRAGWVRGASLRLPNVYGPGPRSSSSDRGVLNVMIRKALSGEALEIYGDGMRLRDYLFVEDAAEAFIAAASRVEAINGRYVVVGSGEGWTIKDAVTLVAERVGRRTGRKVPVVHVESPRPESPIEARDFVANAGLFSSATGWSATVSLKDGIDRTIDAYLSDPAGGR